MKQNIIVDKSYAFAIRIIKLYQHLRKQSHLSDISRQILRSGTSVGANIEEAVGAQSQKDFIHKLSISYKEARETRYWLRLLKDTQVLPAQISDSLIKDCEEILAILGKIKSTLQSNNN